MNTLPEFKRELVREHVNAGLAAARRRGVKFGRPTKLTHAQLKDARERLDAGEKAVCELAGLFGVDRTTPWRRLKEFAGSASNGFSP